MKKMRKKMSNTKDNPWEGMSNSTQRRINYETNHNLFWITDEQGKYGFYIKTRNSFKNLLNITKLKGIGIIKRNTVEGCGELFLILNDNNEWEIFKALCTDLIEQVIIYKTEEKMISSIELRLKRWQQLLKQEIQQTMSYEKQMGLWAEIHCLKELIIPKTGIKQAVISWVGPESDKQDFLLDKAAIEVKSYRTSKGPLVTISSLKQLNSEKEFTYLISLGLTESEKGLSIQDLSNEVKERLSENEHVSQLFESKLLTFGFFPEMFKEPLYKFIIDRLQIFQVIDEFPKIAQENVKSQIINVQYTIDLSSCSDFIITEKEMLI